MWDYEECLKIVAHDVRNDINSLQKLLDISEVSIVDRGKGNFSRVLSIVSMTDPDDYHYLEIFNEKLKTRCILVFEGSKLVRIACGGVEPGAVFNPQEFCRSIAESEITLLKVVLPFFQWREDMIHGFEPLDAQHERILCKWNELIKELIRGGKRVAVILENLVNEVLENMNFEEELMRKYKYPKAKQHFKDHEDFRNLLKQLLERAGKLGALNMLLENMGLVYAYTAHLNDLDHELVSFLKRAIL